MNNQSVARYGSVAQIFHWLTAIVVLIAFIFGPGGSEEHVYSSSGDFDRQLHETLGLCVFALAILRVLWRAFDTRPAPPQTGARRPLDTTARQLPRKLDISVCRLVCGHSRRLARGPHAWTQGTTNLVIGRWTRGANNLG